MTSDEKIKDFFERPRSVMEKTNLLAAYQSFDDYKYKVSLAGILVGRLYDKIGVNQEHYMGPLMIIGRPYDNFPVEHVSIHLMNDHLIKLVEHALTAGLFYRDERLNMPIPVVNIEINDYYEYLT